MCGIGGIFFRNNSDEKIDDVLDNILKFQNHRGPDNRGKWIDKKKNFGLCQNRLSIIDLSENANQPLEINEYVIVFNGEIYNYINLKIILQNLGHEFKTSGDTEVLLRAYLEWGVEALNKISGMYSFAIYNKKTFEIFIARDDVGQKPLFYSEYKNNFIFTSEINAIIKSNNLFTNKIDYESITSFFTKNFRNISAPKTVFSHIKKLRPGHFIKKRIGNINEIEQKCYLKIKSSYSYNDQNIIDTVTNSSISDVGFCTLLSGGYDSTLISLILKKEKKLNFKTYTIGLNEKDLDIVNAKKTASSLDIENKTIYFDFNNSFNRYKNLIINNGEPFALIPNLLSFDLFNQISKDGYKVVITGNGADELFMGYDDANKTILTNILNSLLKKFFFENKANQNFISKASIINKNYSLNSKFFNIELNDSYLYEESNYWQSCLDPKNYLSEHYLMQLYMTHQHSLTLSSDISGMLNSIEVRSPFLDKILINEYLYLDWKKKVNFKLPFHANKKYILKMLFKNLCLKHNVNPKINSSKRGLGYEIKEENLFLNHWSGDLEGIMENFDDLNGFFNKKNIMQYFNDYKSGKNKDNEFISKMLSCQIWLQNL